VTAKVRAHGRGEKISIFKLRRRKNYRRHAGHRQDYTELEITDVAGVGSAPGGQAAAGS
jgi:large subunit ribosomal protein L21